MNNETPEALKPYEFHGLDFSVNGTQAKADCPFCGSTNKFFISKKTGQYDCKKCGTAGNKYTFLTARHEQLKAEVSSDDLQRIRRWRDNVFPASFLKEKGLCLDIEGNVLFPVQNPNNKNLSNLRKWSPSNKVFYNTPQCCSLYLESWYDKGPIYVCEGEWDALALRVLMNRAKHTETCSIVAVPGANTFKESWAKMFENREVILLYDNDHDKKHPNGTTFNPGQDGMAKVTKMLSGVATSVKCIDWSQIDPDLSDGYDLRDYLGDAIRIKKSRRALRRLFRACEPASGSKHIVKALKRTSFERVVQDWREVYAWNQSFEDVLACCFATLISLFLSDRRNPLWLFIVAPPSSGKTTIIEGFKAATEHTIYLSELTPASLVTGLKMESDHSLLHRGNERVWFIEDFTPILNMSGRDEIFGIFRAAYNGFYTAHFATHQRNYDDLHFALIAGVTHAIERIDLGDFGERFLRVRLLDDDFDEDEHIRRALDNVGIRKEQQILLLGGVNGFIDHLLKNKTEPTFDRKINAKLTNLAKLTALIRTEVHYGKSGLACRPQAEVASRIATQLKKLGIALGVVYGRKTVDEECYRVMQKVAFDSCIGWSFELVQALEKTRRGMTVKDLAARMSIHPNQVRKICENALQLEIVTLRQETKSRGRAFRYRLSRKVRDMLEGAGVSFIQKRETKSNRTKRSKRRR